METSNFLSLNTRDFINGLVIAVIGGVVETLHQMLQAGTALPDINWSALLGVALTVALAYLSKNLMTAKNGKVLGAI